MSSSATVIDKLVVTLGLDPKNFKKGEKEAAASLLDLERRAKKTGDEVEKSGDKAGESWVSAGRKFLSVAAIFKILSYTTKNILAAADATYDLSNAARGLDISARYLRNFENVAEIMGGTAEGARKTIAGLHKAIFDASFNGQISEQLVQLGRLGVRFQDAGGHMRDFKDIYLDTAQKIQENKSLTEGEKLEFLQGAGFDSGLARAAVGGRDAASAALAQQEARRQVGDADIAAATGSQQAITSAGQAKDAAFVHAQTGAGGLIKRTANAAESAFNAGNTGDVSVLWDGLKAAVEPLSTGLVNLAEDATTAGASLVGFAHRLRGQGRKGYEDAIQSSAKKYGLDPEILAGVLHTESNFNPDAVNPDHTAFGIAQLKPLYFPGAGVDPVKDIDTAAGELARLKRFHLRNNGGDEADALDRALMSYNAGLRRFQTSTEFGDGSTTRGPLQSETLAYPGKVYDYAAEHPGAAGGGTTSIQIDEITVNTAATDAQGVANGIGNGLQRKLGAAQAEQGMQ